MLTTLSFRAVQVDPRLSPWFVQAWSQSLRPTYDEAVSNSAFNFNLRHYTLAETARNVKFPHTQREVEGDPLTWPSGVKKTRARVVGRCRLAPAKPGQKNTWFQRL